MRVCIKNPLPSLLLASRVWSFIQARLNAGVVHAGKDGSVLGRRSSDLKIHCPVCPTVGINITTLEIDLTPAILRHIYSLHSTLDGNFQLNRYAKKAPVHNIALWKGNGYSPDARVLKEYLLAASNERTEVSFTIQLRLFFFLLI